MIEKSTVVDQIEVIASGTLQIRMKKQIIEGGNVIAFQYHRTVVEPGADPNAQLALVNSHLATLGAAQIESRQWDRVRQIASAIHTPEVVATYQERLNQA